MIQRVITTVIMAAQVILLAIELVTKYDTNGRQLALALTNVVTVGLYLAVGRIAHRRYGITLHWVVLVIIAASVWLDALGNFQHWYAQYWWWDRLTHAIGGLAVTVGFYMVTVALWYARRLAMSWRVLNLYTFCLAQTLGALYEVSEWIGDELFDTHRVQGLFDAQRDIFFNMLGGILVLLVGSWWRMRRRVVNPSQDAR
ncbi:MAG: hypothetical protein HY420_04990 [Candidatus Kerfeldbacteria bacterium]|nr:hypothetical protein [Candidatus Kerfeldbacteria bacterium]